jgi:hypothetical protein
MINRNMELITRYAHFEITYKRQSRIKMRITRWKDGWQTGHYTIKLSFAQYCSIVKNWHNLVVMYG